MELNNDRRGRFDQLEYLSEERVHLTYELPLAEIVLDYYDQLKSRTRGYASFDYDIVGFRPGDLVRVDVLVGGEPVDALSLIVHKDFAYARGKALVERLREEIPRQMFDVAIQAAIGARDHRARDRQGAAQGRAREVLRRRHHAQAQAAREAEEGQEADEAGRRRRGAAGGVPRRAQPRGLVAMSGHVRHLYVHVPFCAHRCGYCDFVTVVGRQGEHDRYVDALLRELELERGRARGRRSRRSSSAAARRRSSNAAALERLLRALPPAAEVTVEANPETVTPELAALLRRLRRQRASRSARRASPRACSTCSSVARSRTTSAAPSTLCAMPALTTSRSTSSTGFPAQSPADLDRDLDEALALEPDHLSCYELEAKPGTRFTHTFGDELARQADAMEGYFERVVERLTGAGYRWYETANFCRPGRLRRRRTSARATTSPTGSAATTSGSGSARSRRSQASAGATCRASRATSRRSRAATAPPREIEPLDAATSRQERVLLGLRLDEPLPLAGLETALDAAALERLERLGLATVAGRTARAHARAGAFSATA